MAPDWLKTKNLIFGGKLEKVERYRAFPALQNLKDHVKQDMISETPEKFENICREWRYLLQASEFVSMKDQFWNPLKHDNQPRTSGKNTKSV